VLAESRLRSSVRTKAERQAVFQIETKVARCVVTPAAVVEALASAAVMDLCYTTASWDGM
jgi:hypothetical protein